MKTYEYILDLNTFLLFLLKDIHNYNYHQCSDFIQKIADIITDNLRMITKDKELNILG